jgi:hypothetical protein
VGRTAPRRIAVAERVDSGHASLAADGSDAAETADAADGAETADAADGAETADAAETAEQETSRSSAPGDELNKRALSSARHGLTQRGAFGRRATR